MTVAENIQGSGDSVIGWQALALGGQIDGVVWNTPPFVLLLADRRTFYSMNAPYPPSAETSEAKRSQIQNRHALILIFLKVNLLTTACPPLLAYNKKLLARS